MIDTYFDRADAALGYPRRQSTPVWDDPRCYNGQLYATMIDRNVAEAKDKLRYMLANACMDHKWEIAGGVRMGDAGSWFLANGRRKTTAINGSTL